MFESLARNAADFAAKISFDALVWLTWGSFAALFILTLTLTLALPELRVASKRPFLCLVYAYTAVTLALFLTVNAVEYAAFTACIFWIIGYLSYGLLCAVSRKRKTAVRRAPAQVAACAAPALPVKAPVDVPPAAPAKPVRPAPGATVARNNVRLEHAIAVTNKLLEKNLGKTDRQELEKLKNTLEVLKIKGSLTPAEGEILNENFNTLLKLMAKYNV